MSLSVSKCRFVPELLDLFDVALNHVPNLLTSLS